MKPDNPKGTLYVVATPIGNLADISHRALDVLRNVDLILAEDTRHSKRLLNHYGISNALRSCHEHNEAELIEFVANQLQAGQDIALISDAGTPLISDPGFVLVRALREKALSICTVPGASSIIAALSIAGVPTDRFTYDGFLPNKSSARKTQLQEYLSETRTIVVLESSHRILASVRDIVEVLGKDREIVLARELTKKFETVLHGPAEQIMQQLEDEPLQSKGEFVLLIKGSAAVQKGDAEVAALLRILLSEVPLKQAAKLAAKMSGKNKNEVYQLALSIKDTE